MVVPLGARVGRCRAVFYNFNNNYFEIYLSCGILVMQLKIQNISIYAFLAQLVRASDC